MKFRISILLFVASFVVSYGQSIFTNPITGTNPNTANPYTTGQTVSPNMTASGIGRGSGLTGTTANDRYNATAWSTSSIDLTDYFEFTLTPASGYQINLVSFVYTGQASGTGPGNFAFRSSIDGYASNIGTATTSTTISLSSSTYQNLTSATTFRLYAWGGTGGTYSVNDFTFNGAVAVVAKTSFQTGDWNVGATWVGGVAPSATDNVIIASSHVVTNTTNITRNSGTVTTVNTGGTLATTASYTNSGATTINGTFQINAGGYASGNSFVYGSAGILSMNHNNGSSYGISVGQAFWPTSNPPFDVNINTNSPLQLSMAVGPVAGTLTLRSQLNLSTAITLNGNLFIAPNGYISTQPPVYGNSSTLVYSTNYSVGTEWTGNATTAGSGVPKNVTIQNSATVTMPTTSRGLAGDLTISSGGLALSGTSGSDLYLAGNWTRASAATFTPNGRAVIFNATTAVDQTINVTGGTSETFSYLTAGGAGTLRPTVALNVTASSGLSLASSNGTSTINLNAQILTLSGGGNLNLNAGTRLITSSSSGGVLRITSNPITVTNGGSLSFAATNTTIDLQNGLDCGVSSLVTVNGKLQINTGGYCLGNSPKYGSASTLQYNTGTNPYNRSLEWTAAAGIIGTTAGYPKHVQISNNTKLNYVNATNLGEKGVDGNLTIDAGSALYMNYGSVTCGGALLVAGDLSNAGDMTLGFAVGDDLKVTGNVNFTGSYSFDANKRAVILKGGATQTISASSKPTFHYLNLDGGNSMIADITCDLDITAPDGGNVISFSNASQVVKLNAGRTLALGTAGVANTFSATTGSFNGSTTSNLTLRGNGSIGTLKFVTSLNLGTFTVDRQNSVSAFTLGTSLTVNSSLIMSKGLADLGAQTMTLTATATASGNTNSYVIADVDGTAGRLRKTVTSSSGLFTFPIGDAAASANGSEYSPATVQFSTGNFSASTSYLDVATKDDYHPSIDASSPDRITRYWKMTTSGTFTSLNYTFTGTYTDADVEPLATESTFKAGRWNGSEWTEGSSVSTATNILSISGLTTVPATNEFSAGFPLGLGEINVRGNGNDILTADTTPSATDKTDFGKLCADKESTFTIQNVTGARGPLLISGVTITGAHASDFTLSGIITSPALSLAVAGSTTFKVTFNPSGDGLRTATVTIASNDANENPYTFSIQGTGDEEINLKANGDEGGGSASASIANNDMDASQAQDYLNNTRFAETDIGVESVAKIYLIENLGMRDLTLSGSPRVVISGAHPSDFFVSQIVPLSPANITTCSSANFRITFKPTAPGDRTAVVTITNSDSDEGTYTFALQGKGREAEIDVKGNNVTIVSGTTATSDANHTKFANANITSGTATRTYTIYNSGSGSLNVSNPVISGADAADFTVTANPSSTVAATSGTTTFTITFDPTTTGIKTATVSIANSDVDENPYTFNIEGKGINYIECASASVINIGVQDFEDSPATPTWTYSVTGTASKLGGTAYGIDGDSGATPKYIGAKSLQFADSNTDNATITSSVAEFANIDTSNFTEIELSLRVGAFSVNAGNGMESTDYVLVSVSPDGGTSWTQEIRVKGAVDNKKWSFSATGNATGAYDNNNTVESGKDYGPTDNGSQYRTTDGYSTITLTNLPNVANLKIRITLSNSHSNEIWAIDNVILKGKTNDVKTWDGTNWRDAANGITTAPTSYQKAIIDGDYDSVINGGSIWACEVEVTENGNVVVDANSILDVQSAISNDGTISLENNASLIQYDDSAVVSGAISMERHTQPIYRYDYTYWSSPVTEDSAFTLAALSPETLADKYYYWDATTQAWAMNYNGTESMIPGKGYIIRAPQPFPLLPADAVAYEDGVFAGKPNNGEITYAINGSQAPGTDIWNLIGNPYPCALNIEKFFDIATGNRDVLDGTLYFWTHNTPVEENAYANSDYASYNFTGGVGTAAGDGANQNIPNGYVAAGQAFFVKGLSNGADTVFFNNSMRGGLNNQFFRSAATVANSSESRESHRVWLNITAGQAGFNQTLIGYVQGATNDIDWGFDGQSFSGNNVSLYSLTDDKKLTIQGRALPFDDQDFVGLGYTSLSAGSLTIKIDHVDGLFENQNIYLEDLLLNTVHDLKSAPYTFTSLAGTFDQRFVLRYTNATLGIEPVNVDNGLIVFKDKKQLQFVSQLEPISDILVFDLAGRLLFQKKAVNANSFAAGNVALNQQVLIVKVKMANGRTLTRKIIY